MRIFSKHDIPDITYNIRAHLRKAGHACSMHKKAYFNKFTAVQRCDPAKQQVNLSEKIPKNACGYRTQKLSKVIPVYTSI